MKLVELLNNSNFFEQKDGIWIKTNLHIRYPTKAPLPAIRAYHKNMLEKALANLVNGIDKKSFERRSISSVSVASNPQNLKKAKERLSEMMYEIANILSEGDCTEIYQLNVQLFPLTSDIQD
ncbi:MAG: TIGR02147 family protein [Pseudobdellovibrionaceae bacterium]